MRSALALVFMLGSANAEADSTPIGGVHPNIVGGNPVTPYEHNWVLQLIATKQGRTYLCGASLIGAEWPLTAAHCTYGIQASNMKVHVHRHRTNGGDGHECAETLNVDKKFEYDEYDDRKLENDVALLRLSQPVRCADSITMPSLDDGSSSGAGTTVTVAGWGTTSEGGSSPKVLHSVDLKLLTNAQCEAYGYRGDLISSSICAIGDLKGGEDSCQGDSGGPLFVQQGGVDIIVGIVSWGRGCAQKRIAGVYARVSSFQAWIKKTSNVATGNAPPSAPSPPMPPPAPSPPMPPPAPTVSCECSSTSTGCLSGGQDVSDRCGCSTHGTEFEPFCYVVEPTRCPSAVASSAISGAAWVDCIKTDSPFSPPAPPPSPMVRSDVRVTRGQFPTDVSWVLKCDGLSDPIAGGARYFKTHKVPPGECELSMRDAFGDGWQGATWTAPGWTDQTFTCRGYRQTVTFTVASQPPPSPSPPPPLPLLCADTATNCIPKKCKNYNQAKKKKCKKTCGLCGPLPPPPPPVSAPPPDVNCPGLADKNKCKIKVATCNKNTNKMKQCKKKCKKDRKKKKLCQKNCCELGFPV